MLKTVAVCLDAETATKLATVIRERFDLLEASVRIGRANCVSVECFSETDFYHYLDAANFFLRGMEFAIVRETEKLRTERLALEQR